MEAPALLEASLAARVMSWMSARRAVRSSTRCSRVACACWSATSACVCSCRRRAPRSATPGSPPLSAAGCLERRGKVGPRRANHHRPDSSFKSEGTMLHLRSPRRPRPGWAYDMARGTSLVSARVRTRGPSPLAAKTSADPLRRPGRPRRRARLPRCAAGRTQSRGAARRVTPRAGSREYRARHRQATSPGAPRG